MMGDFMDSAVRRLRRAFVLSVAVLLSLGAQSARAADAPKSAAVTIRQINPAGDTQSVTCVQNKLCLLTIALAESNPVQKETVTVQVDLAPKTLLLEFKTPRGYLYVGENLPDPKKNTYEVIWHGPLADDRKLSENITLYLPVVPRPVLAPILYAADEAAKNNAHPAVATVEVMVQPRP
jgi:hypothetical protein